MESEPNLKDYLLKLNEGFIHGLKSNAAIANFSLPPEKVPCLIGPSAVDASMFMPL